MIVVGSSAAALGGFLPSWRAGRRPADLDIVCTASGAETVAAFFGRRPTWNCSGGATCFDGITSVDMLVRPAGLVEAMRVLCGDVRDLVFGHAACRFATGRRREGRPNAGGARRAGQRSRDEVRAVDHGMFGEIP